VVILVTGAGGFIGRAVVRALGLSGRPASHQAFREPARFADITAVVHAGRHPLLGQPGYRVEEDAELAVARLAAARDLPVLSLGSRKVYAPSSRPLAEDAPLGPTDRYGEQKLALEQALERILGPRLTRLRLANIFGFEPGRQTFMGLMLRALAREEPVSFDMSPFVARDFLPVETAAQAIARLATNPPGGTVNIGSGIGLATGRLALALIEGHGRGRLLVTDPRHHDPFTLDVTRLTTLTGIATDATAILDRARAIGRELRAAGAKASPGQR
jgi:nucleoside-diphosphate-sugar epimerase